MFRARKVTKMLQRIATLVVLVGAAVSLHYGWTLYVTSPWTRDGMVRVQVANIAPQISGQIVEVKVVDNQPVKKGDVLYKIDPLDFEVALASARANFETRVADLEVKQAQNVRRASLTTLSTSTEEKQVYDGAAKMAEAARQAAQAQVVQAEINLKRTEVVSPVDGYVTNLLMRVGDYARAGVYNISVIDSKSFWVDGYFEETKLENVRIGDPVEVRLIGYAQPIRGSVESITGGISASNAASSTQGLPNVDPVFTWVRLAQRIPVRIHIDHVPGNVQLVAGMTGTIVVTSPEEKSAKW